MAGLYLHIPFCKQACHYCDFHFSTSLRLKTELLDALARELALRSGYLGGAELASVYLGGGTPSILESAEIVGLFEAINRHYRVAPDAEITLEANPDDLDADKVADLRAYTPVNRLSIGIQSFDDADLRWMNRAHSAGEAHACLERVAAAGFDDLTIDLIYGAPNMPHERWRANLRTAIGYGVPHLSCYNLTVEPGTALHHFVAKGKSAPVDDVHSAEQFEILLDATEAAGYEAYEISNFALPGRYARHNSSYWSGAPYLGIGPSAHSFDGRERRWNAANNARYVRALQEGVVPFESERLTPAQRYNEYVMTALRTQWGVDPERLEAHRGHFEREARPLLDGGALALRDGRYVLTRQGKLMADRIAMALFFS
jgi:oxygen-independent coproporphyrinogen-3 oxidase